MLELVTTTQFHKDLKRLRKRGANIQEFDTVLQTLCAEEPLSEKHRDPCENLIQLFAQLSETS